MKKLFLVLCFFLISTAANAQLLNGYGIKLGMGITNHTWKFASEDFEINWDYNTGMSIRAFADFLDDSNYNIEGEIGYSQKGVKDEYFNMTVENPDPTAHKYANRLNYVSAAIMGKMKCNIGIFTPYLLLGPQFNYLVSKDVLPMLDVVYNRFKKNIWGYTAGAGSVIRIQNLNLLLEYRFERDFNNNMDVFPIDIKNYSHSVLMGIQF
ncbi:MAG: outer membrane beta-barrel protein [Clostridiales bacterium]